MNQARNVSVVTTMMITVEVQYATSYENLPDQDFIRNCVETACDNIVQQPVEILVRLVDTEESKALNHQYRGKNKPTNVLSFCADVPEYIDSNELGDIVICAEVVANEAKQQNKLLMAHWAHMVVHGVLHLNGYDHQDTAEAEKMEQLEKQILAKLGFPDPYIEN